MTTAIVLSLLQPTFSFFGEVSFGDFLTGTTWAPTRGEFGVWPLVVGTMTITVVSLIVAVPVGLLSAIYLSEYAHPRVRQVLKPALEVLAGIPTVAIGLFAIGFLRPFLEDVLPFLDWKGDFSAAVAGVGVGLLIVPLVASVSEDAMRAVPAGLREGAYALGATKMRVSLRVVVPGAISGIVAAMVLGASRAVGETMVVVMAAGRGKPELTWDPLDSMQTMTAYIAGVATGDASTGTIEYDTIFAVGTLLFVMTLVMNMFAIRLVRRFREVYE
ncbi:phosphate ABC transporter permease subunit PstC [Streptomyces sp. 6N223]|uniref:phosphate ABC transporter permease subunit PstC n=1 Tax=Streptomyces sp. 6N223 TaxID=3457412 RepID=UPI003FCEFB01